MAFTEPHRWGPGETPVPVRWLIILTCTLSLFSALTNNLFEQIIGIAGPQQFLGLSWQGLAHYFLWQPITYLFIQESGLGVHIFFLIGLFFNMYILWILGSTLYERIGSHVIGLYLISGALAGLCAILLMPLVGHYAILTGPSAALLGLFMVWTMCNPDSELMLFFILPIQTKWLLTSLVGAVCLISLSQADLISFAFYITGVIVGYLYGLLVLGIRGPFTHTHSFDDAVIHIGERLRRIFNKSSQGSSKVVDIRHVETLLDDDAFIDEMLAKISKYGEGSLTRKERRRMDEISANKAKK